MQTQFSGFKSAHIRLNFSPFKIEETYTLTTFVDKKLSLSVYSKSTYDSLVWLGFFDLSKLLKKKKSVGRSFIVQSIYEI